MYSDLPLNIILVEDEPAHAEAICRAFRAAVPEVSIRLAESLSDYRALLLQQTPDVAILDMNLPDGSALDVLSAPAETLAFPVVAMTSFGNEEVAVAAMKAGALDYIVKSPEAFLAMPKNIASVMREWKLILERKSLEKKMMDVQKLESLGVLAGGIAHDFNNLLMAILGHADLALSKMNPETPGREHILEIEMATRRAADLCRQMLAYSGKGKFIVETVDLQKIIEEMAHMLKTSISKKAQLIMNFGKDLPPFKADVTQIRQILMNLVINASEAIGDGSGVIEISTGHFISKDVTRSELSHIEDLPPGHYLFVEVADTGCGMSRDVIAKIFDPFFTTKFTGRGLGMSAVIGIVKAHSGLLQIKSSPGEGSRFTVILPALPGASIDSVRPDDSSLAWSSGGTVLLVDDEEVLLALGSMMLEALGVKVLKACDGWEALQVFKEHQSEIRCVLLDLTMPHMDGAEAFSELRKINPDVKIVLASGFSEHEIENRFAGKNLSGVLQKPYSLDSLRKVLARVFNG